ncbi:MFS transporter [Allosaccharopolyspora coralli]|uniref:MFS transporter n=1 Tax=Allosaccharopolyspora coralli TaxID=2665642 RepID=UPI001651F16A|nr:MFS transporter [Allosaccharopolyspora coralli]
MSTAERVQRRNLVLLWASQFVNTAGLMMLVPIMPFYVQGMGVDGTAEVQTWAGVAIAAPALALTVATPLWGRLGDRIGRHWMVVRSLVGLAVSMLVMALAGNPFLLVLGRLLQGGLGGVVEAAQAFAGAAGPGSKRGSALGKSFSATAAGSLIGPLAGGALVGAGALSTLMIVIAVLAVVLAGACTLGLREPDATETSAPASAPSAPANSVGRAGFWHVPAAVPLVIVAVAAYFGVYGLIPVFAQHVQQSFPAGQAGMWVGVFQSLTWAATLIASFWWGRHNDRAQRPIRTLAVASGVCAVSIAAQALPLGPAGLIVLRLLQGAAFAALAQSLFFHFSQHAPSSRRSGYVGMANSFLLAGQSAGPLLAGPMALAFPTPLSIALMGAACAVACLCCLRASRMDAEPHTWGHASTDTNDSANLPVLRQMSGVLESPSEQTAPIRRTTAATVTRGPEPPGHVRPDMNHPSAARFSHASAGHRTV